LSGIIFDADTLSSESYLFCGIDDDDDDVDVILRGEALKGFIPERKEHLAPHFLERCT
jgi:hypothetical protein